jgi:hypothetical protein
VAVIQVLPMWYCSKAKICAIPLGAERFDKLPSTLVNGTHSMKSTPACSPRPLRLRYLFSLLATSMLVASSAQADAVTAHITRVSYITTGVLIMLDTGPPTNCSGTPSGWMMIAAPYTAMIAFVSGLWFRGDAAAKPLVVYTSSIDGTGFCQISQIDTMSAG